MYLRKQTSLSSGLCADNLGLNDCIWFIFSSIVSSFLFKPWPLTFVGVLVVNWEHFCHLVLINRANISQSWHKVSLSNLKVNYHLKRLHIHYTATSIVSHVKNFHFIQIWLLLRRKGVQGESKVYGTKINLVIQSFSAGFLVFFSTSLFAWEGSSLNYYIKELMHSLISVDQVVSAPCLLNPFW